MKTGNEHGQSRLLSQLTLKLVWQGFSRKRIHKMGLIINLASCRWCEIRCYSGGLMKDAFIPGEMGDKTRIGDHQEGGGRWCKSPRLCRGTGAASTHLRFVVGLVKIYIEFSCIQAWFLYKKVTLGCYWQTQHSKMLIYSWILACRL